ncbi:DoxX family protein [Nocardia fluminea]|uniref:DoxX family protein n=1 Tax=Nocardia fluminea TaxID=134984 RepID=UPI003648F8B8
MSIAFIVLSLLLALAFAAAGVPKLTGAAKMREQLDGIGVSRELATTIGALELVAAAGLIVGIWFTSIGIAAAVGLALLTAGAAIFHVRAGDTKNLAGPVVLLVLAIATAAIGMTVL